MKLVTYSHGSEYAVGVLKNDGSEVVPVNYLGFDVKDMNEFLELSRLSKADAILLILSASSPNSLSEEYSTLFLKLPLENSVTAALIRLMGFVIVSDSI